MIRILQIVTNMRACGLETLLMNYYRQLDRDNFQFDFLVHRKVESEYDSEIRSLGGNVFHLPRLNPLNPRYLSELDSFFEQHHYDICHVHLDCMSSVVLKAAKKHHVKVRICHSHTSAQDYDAKYPLKMIYRSKIPGCATDLVACGNAAGRFMFGNHTFDIIPNAVDAEKFRFCADTRADIRSELGIPENAVVIGHVGRFERVKNHKGLLDIFKRVLEIDRDARILLCGGGELYDKIYRYAEKNGISDSVIFVGVRNDVCRIMQGIDAFALPSRYEGTPLTLIEAQCAGLCCVVSDNVPIDADFTENVRRISVDNVNEWAVALLDAAKKPRLDLFEDAVAAGFDIHSAVKRLEDYYGDRMSGNGAENNG